MNVNTTLEIDAALRLKAPIVSSIGNACKKYFADKDYGGGIGHLLIGLILIAPSNPLHPVRPFRFRKREIVKISPSHKVEYLDCASYEIKPDYNYVAHHDGEELLRFLCDAVYISTEILYAHKNKFSDFEVDRFRNELKALLIP